MTEPVNLIRKQVRSFIIICSFKTIITNYEKSIYIIVKFIVLESGMGNIRVDTKLVKGELNRLTD